MKGTFNEGLFTQELYSSMCNHFSNEEWEYALVEGLSAVFPPPCIVRRTGGKLEVEHGTDITITIPGLLDTQYIIAIQVKDYEGYISGAPIKQLAKADGFWNKNNDQLIDKILIVTKSSKSQNIEINENNSDIRIIFCDELQELLTIIGKAYLGLRLESV